MRKLGVILPLAALVMTLVTTRVIGPPVPHAAAQSGQTLSQTFRFEDGTTLRYPETWWARIGPDGFIYLESPLTSLLFGVNAPSYFADFGLAERDLVGLLTRTFSPAAPSETFDPAAVQLIQIGPYIGVRSVTTAQDAFGRLEHWVLALQLNNGLVWYISAINKTGDALTEAAVVLEILASLDESQSTYPAESLDWARPTLEQSAVLFSDASLSFPANWGSERLDQPDAAYNFRLFSAHTMIVFNYLTLDTYVLAGLPTGDVAGLLARLFIPYNDQVVYDPARAYGVWLGDYWALRYDYTDTDTGGVPFARTVLLVPLHSGDLLFVSILPASESTLVERPIALQILASLTEPVMAAPALDYYTFEDGTTLAWDTATWTFSQDEFGGLYLDSAATSVFFTKYPTTVYLSNGVATGDTAGLMAALFFASDATLTFDPAQYQAVTIGDFHGGRYDFVDRDADGLEFQHSLILLQFSDTSVALFSIVPVNATTLSEMEQVLAIVASFTDVP